MRCFFAVPLPAELAEKIICISKAASYALREDHMTAKPVEKVNLHITLRFLGDIDKSKIESLCEIVDGAIKTIKPGIVKISGLKCFPDQHTPRVLTLGVYSNKVLLQLHDAVEDKLAGFGIGSDGKRFTPHITLARVKEPKPAAVFSNWTASVGPIDPDKFEVDGFDLYESVLKPSGPVYSVVCKFTLSR